MASRTDSMSRPWQSTPIEWKMLEMFGSVSSRFATLALLSVAACGGQITFGSDIEDSGQPAQMDATVRPDAGQPPRADTGVITPADTGIVDGEPDAGGGGGCTPAFPETPPAALDKAAYIEIFYTPVASAPGATIPCSNTGCHSVGATPPFIAPTLADIDANLQLSLTGYWNSVRPGDATAGIIVKHGPGGPQDGIVPVSFDPLFAASQTAAGCVGQ